MAVRHAEGAIRFTQNRINSGNSRISQTGELVVLMTTLDWALRADSSGVDLLVVDTEGFEAGVIRGAPQSAGSVAQNCTRNDASQRRGSAGMTV